MVAFIPRKPHPLGIVAYLGAVRLSNTGLPFVMDILPVTSAFGLSGPHAFQAFLKNVPGTKLSFKSTFLSGILGPLPKNDLHMVVDALFATRETITTASSLDICVTWSQNSAHKANLHSLLADGLPKGRWRMACVPGEEGHRDHYYFVLNDSKMMMGGSTAFQPVGNLAKG